MPVYIDAVALRDALERQMIAVNERNYDRRAGPDVHANWSYIVRDTAVVETLASIVNVLDEMIAGSGN